MRELSFSRNNNGEDQELRFYQKVGGAWERLIMFGDDNQLPPVSNTIKILSPTQDSVIAESPMQVRISAPTAYSVTLLLDGVSTGSLLSVNSLWQDSLDLDNISPGQHTIAVTARISGGSDLTTSVAFSTTFVPGGGTIDPPVASPAVALTKPDSTDPNAFISGTAYYPEVTVDVATVGVPSKVEWQYGALVDSSLNPEFAWRSMARVGSTNVWRSVNPIDTRHYLITQGEVNTGEATQAQRNEALSDVFWDMQAQITMPNASVIASSRLRVISGNRSPRRVGTTPTWKSKFAFTADYSSMSAYVTKIRAAHPSGTTGSLWGKETPAMEIVTDPIAEGVGGHHNHGNVVYSHVPMNYHELTKGTKSSWSSASYSSTYGDQPNSNFRWQHVYPGRFMEGDMAYWGRAVMLKSDFPTPANHLSMGQMYQETYVWGLAQMLEGKYKNSNHAGPNQADNWKYWGSRFSPYERDILWSLPFIRGKWVDIITGFGVSRDGRVGWMEIYTRRPDVNGGALTQHIWPDGTTRLRIALLQESAPATGSGIQLHDHFYWASTLFGSSAIGTTAQPVKGYWAKQKVAGTVAEADPHSY